MLSSSSSIIFQSSSSSGRYFLGTEWKATEGRISDSLMFSVMVCRMWSRYSWLFQLGRCSMSKSSLWSSCSQELKNWSFQGMRPSISTPRMVAVSKAQQRDTFSMVQPPPPRITVGTPNLSMQSTQEAWPLIDRLRCPSRSFEMESAPHWTTQASGRYEPITVVITFLKSSKQALSSMPFLSGTLTEKNLPMPSPTEFSAPVPGKKSSSNSWKETVMTRLVLQKASSTPSPWCTSISRQSTLGYTFNSQRMQMTISFTQQKPLASVFFAWWQPPAQFIAMSEMPVMMMSAASMLPPAASWQKWQSPSKPGQSKLWLTLNSDLSLESSLIFLFSSSLYCVTISSFLPVTHFSRYSIQG